MRSAASWPATRSRWFGRRRTERLGYSMTIYPWARACQTGLAQPNVLMFSIVRTRERERQCKLMAGRVDLVVASMASLKGICASAGVPRSLERTMAMPGLTDYYVAQPRHAGRHGAAAAGRVRQGQAAHGAAGGKIRRRAQVATQVAACGVGVAADMPRCSSHTNATATSEVATTT